jgi:hypothetical protein
MFRLPNNLINSTDTRRWLSLQPPARTVSSPANFSTLKMEAIRSSETSVNTRPTQSHFPEDDILHSHRSESLKSYKCIDLTILKTLQV